MKIKEKNDIHEIEIQTKYYKYSNQKHWNGDRVRSECPKRRSQQIDTTESHPQISVFDRDEQERKSCYGLCQQYSWLEHSVAHGKKRLCLFLLPSK